MLQKPIYSRILVELDIPLEKTKGGIIIDSKASEKHLRGTVVASGEGYRKEDGTLTPLTVKVGDRVLFSEIDGNQLTFDGKDYRVLQEEEVILVLNEEKE